ncbi:MAG TPA: hypothetical protein PLG50_07260 [bacterium]|nr:hypothetical protein [bacterium]HQG45441.1 hypothetical protein [bacterium]HQI48757.1 hypothetical protein [bacterium]HQJ66494.1 hypothetical protein [bacterium]
MKNLILVLLISLILVLASGFAVQAPAGGTAEAEVTLYKSAPKVYCGNTGVANAYYTGLWCEAEVYSYVEDCDNYNCDSDQIWKEGYNSVYAEGPTCAWISGIAGHTYAGYGYSQSWVWTNRYSGRSLVEYYSDEETPAPITY